MLGKRTFGYNWTLSQVKFQIKIELNELIVQGKKHGVRELECGRPLR